MSINKTSLVDEFLAAGDDFEGNLENKERAESLSEDEFAVSKRGFDPSASKLGESSPLTSQHPSLSD